MTDRRYDLHDKIAERDAVMKEFGDGVEPQDVFEGGGAVEEMAQRMAEAIIEIRKANGWKGPVDRKSYPKNHNTFKHSQPYMEELVAMLQEELGKHYDVPKIEYLTDELEKGRAYSEKLEERLSKYETIQKRSSD